MVAFQRYERKREKNDETRRGEEIKEKPYDARRRGGGEESGLVLCEVW
jgi:hypothetical protein